MDTSKFTGVIGDDVYNVLTMLEGRSGQEIFDIAKDLILISVLSIGEKEGLERSLESIDELVGGTFRTKEFLMSRYGG